MVVVVTIAVAAMAGGAWAQATAEAEQAFRDGKRMMGEKQYAQACAAFATSERLAASVGAKTSLADCYEKRGKLASAWGQFLEVAAAIRGDATKDALRETVTARIAALEPRLPFLTISVPDASVVEGLTISRNDTLVDPGLWNRAVPIDQGTYVVRARAPGREPWSTTVVIDGEGVRQTVDVPRFEVVVAPRAAESSTVPRARSRRWLAPVALGAGAGVLGAVALGLELSGRRTLSDYEAGGGADLLDDANRKHHVAQGLAIAGIGCAAAAVIVWYARPTPPRAAQSAVVPTLAPGRAGLALIGAF